MIRSALRVFAGLVVIGAATFFLAPLRKRGPAQGAPALRADHGEDRESKAPFRQLGAEGHVQFVLIDEAAARDRNVYRQAIAQLAATDPVVVLMFWTDQGAMPDGLPMTEGQLGSTIAQYNRNRASGIDRLRFFEGSGVAAEFSPP